MSKIIELDVWLNSVEEMNGSTWVPDSAQWKIIRDKIKWFAETELFDDAREMMKKPEPPQPVVIKEDINLKPHVQETTSCVDKGLQPAKNPPPMPTVSRSRDDGPITARTTLRDPY